MKNHIEISHPLLEMDYQISLAVINGLVAHLTPSELETVVISRDRGYGDDPDNIELHYIRQETDEEEAEREAAEAQLKQATKDAKKARKKAALEAERATYERLKLKFEK